MCQNENIQIHQIFLSISSQDKIQLVVTKFFGYNQQEATTP